MRRGGAEKIRRDRLHRAVEQSRKLLKADSYAAIEPSRRAAFQNHCPDPLTRYPVIAERLQRNQWRQWRRGFLFRQKGTPSAEPRFRYEALSRPQLFASRVIYL